MKTKEEIEKRLRKLRMRCAHKYVQKSQERRHLNCSFNESHQVSSFSYAETKAIEMPIAPRDQVTLVVFQDKPNVPVHLCMYGYGNTGRWLGSVCDSDEIAKSCSIFKPRVDIKTAQKEFLDLTINDEYIFDNYRDIATLQWVLGERVHDIPLTLWEKFSLWTRGLFVRTEKLVPNTKHDPIPEDFWDDSSTNT